MKKISWQVWLGIILVLVSAAIYFAHYFLFHDAHHIFIYLVGDIAFVPIEVLLVTLILHQLLNRREKQSMLKKMNMVIGAFFSEVGMPLLKMLKQCDGNLSEKQQHLLIKPTWKERDFAVVVKLLEKDRYVINSKSGDLASLKEFLSSKRNFLLGLLENPNLLEHDQFTDLLWAVFHLTEELIVRKNTHQLPQSDCDHLSGDIKRAYSQLIMQWVLYMKHMKTDYPYLFSLAVRTNPFDQNAKPEIY
jgi:hypothetical protein